MFERSRELAEIKKVLVTGGAGYVGSALVPKLIDAGYLVNVLDLYLYGDDVFGDHHSHPNLREIRGIFEIDQSLKMP